MRIDSYLRIPERATEAGGILIGCYRGPHIEITECSEPLRRDRRARLRFDRDDPGHQGLASRRWSESGRTHTFVGEWHTHPGFSSTPSTIDLKTWREITRHNIAGSSVFLIRGDDGWWAALGTARSLTQMSLVPPDDE
ncbi:Mov34/MPN/PAD-1 family protein [Bradyrhizobium brasilense]|uniref:Mov34/MPN/PAD-1 family protein n=1 Tax=Bradyrhizobium brasilense TaxID=1419277 RepID=UPI003CC504F5